MGMRGHPRGDPAPAGVTPTQAGVANQPAAILNKLIIKTHKGDIQSRIQHLYTLKL